MVLGEVENQRQTLAAAKGDSQGEEAGEMAFAWAFLATDDGCLEGNDGVGSAVGSTLDNGAIGTVRAIFCVASSEGLEGVIEGGILADVTDMAVAGEHHSALPELQMEHYPLK
nr:hypothetical protein Iba_chr04aCG15730 [Ipomoea batatas]